MFENIYCQGIGFDGLHLGLMGGKKTRAMKNLFQKPIIHRIFFRCALQKRIFVFAFLEFLHNFVSLTRKTNGSGWSWFSYSFLFLVGAGSLRIHSGPHFLKVRKLSAWNCGINKCLISKMLQSFCFKFLFKRNLKCAAPKIMPQKSLQWTSVPWTGTQQLVVRVA